MIATLASLLLFAPTNATIDRRMGLQVVTFALPQGVVRVFLPDDMMAGDTISGTVVAQPNGSTPAEREANTAELRGMVVEAPKAKAKVGDKLKFLIPVALAAPIPFVLKSASGKTVGTANPDYWSHDPFAMPSRTPIVPPICQTAAPLKVLGSFDGDSANTVATVGGVPATVLAETPRSSVVQVAPSTPPGPGAIVIGEPGWNAGVNLEVVSLKLQASKSTLLAGEKATVTATVTGLRHEAPLQITNLSPTVLQFAGTTATVVSQMIQPSSDLGPVIAVLDVVGIMPGAFGLRGVVMLDVKHDAKVALPASQLNAWVRQLRAEMERQIAALAGNKDKATRKELLEKVLNGLKNISFGSNDPATTKSAMLTALDYNLNLISALDVGCALIGIAADLLGYTNLPMPSILSVLKSVKALGGLGDAAGKLDKAIELAEAYEKLSDAKEKLAKAKEVRDAVKQAQDALKSSAKDQ